MPLRISYVERLADVLAPAREFLSRERDLFAKPRIVVPTAGAKAWLWSELATSLGAGSGGSGDGIVTNVDFSYPGTISTLLDPDDHRAPDVDPWGVEQLTFTILELIADETAFAPIVKRAGGPLLAARRIADRFDHYHFRRPGMILEWEAGRPRLSPVADEQGARVVTRLNKSDHWQFDLWRAVRERIAVPSPPVRDRQARGPAPEAVLVAGLQGLSLHQVELLTKLAHTPSASGQPCDVQVVLVHPSPALRETWAAAAPPVTAGVAPTRRESAPPAGVDPLVNAWLRGTLETQWLLASQGLEPAHAAGQPPESPPAGTSLLHRLKETVATGRTAATGDPAFNRGDRSVLIHRCHDLGRQAEVLHDAILHAFRELEGLAPHEVVIVSPQIANLAPHLEATFARAVRGDGDAEIHLPLLVADRGIREVSRGAELLAAVIELVGSRCSVDGMLAVAGHPLVQAHFGIDDDAVDAWQRCIERTRIRWGLDADRRVRDGLDRPGLAAHTWRLGLERAILGAVVPDGDPEPVLGGVVPLAHVDAAEVADLAPLASIFGVIDDLDRDVSKPRAVGEWCDLLETALSRLAGDENDDLAVPLRELDALRQAAAAAVGRGESAASVPYHDVKSILAATLAAPVGRQPLRTGMITATSMIPLRGVPFRVVCVAGFDNDAVNPRESDAEDLADREPRLLGDGDARLEIRRGLLDCLLAAEQRLIVTCTGMDVKNNATLPLVTPLAEFVDFVERHGVPTVDRDDGQHSAIEVFHPRHACSRLNFVAGPDGVVKSDVAWSHDAAALAAARALGKDTTPPPLVVSGLEPPTHIEFEWLAAFMHDPLWPYVRRTLGINTWRDDDLSIPATLPLELEAVERRRLMADYIDGLLATAERTSFAESWGVAARANGDVPVLGFGDALVTEITQFADSLLTEARNAGVPLDECVPATLRVDLDGLTLSGSIDRCFPNQQTIRTIVLVRPDAMDSSSDQFLRAKMQAVVLQLAAKAQGQPVERAVILNQHKDWFPGAVKAKGAPLPAAQVRKITLHESIDASRARQLLAELCSLYRQAAGTPCGTFGDATAKLQADPQAARDAFGTFTSGRRYATSNEAVVHGPQPDFDDVFPDDPAVTAFFARFHALTHLTRQYVYTPDAP
jgi:exodeoxyribonuclease V gamma subunit